MTQENHQPLETKDDFEVLKRSSPNPHQEGQHQHLSMRPRSNTNPNIQRSRRSEPIMGSNQINSQQLHNMINPQILTQQQPKQRIQHFNGRPAMPLPSQQNVQEMHQVQNQQHQQLHHQQQQIHAHQNHQQQRPLVQMPGNQHLLQPNQMRIPVQVHSTGMHQAHTQQQMQQPQRNNPQQLQQTHRNPQQQQRNIQHQQPVQVENKHHAPSHNDKQPMQHQVF